MAQKSERPVPGIVWVGLVLLGALMALVGSAAVIISFFLPTIDDFSLPPILVGYGAVSLLLGIGLATVGLRGRQGRPSRRLHSRWAWLGLLVLAFILFLAALLLPADWHASPLFGLLHMGTIGATAFSMLFLVIALVGPDAALSLRELNLTLSGSVLSIAFVIPLEILGLLLSVLFVTVTALVFFEGGAHIQSLIDLLEQWTTTPAMDPEQMLSLLASPVVLGVAALTLAVVAPLVEELAKTLVIGVMGIWRRPSPAGAFVWGVACGVGFAIVEGVSNGAMALGSSVGWGSAVVVRGLATAMHALTSGLLGLGWGLAWQRKRWALPLMYIVAVLFHGLWNLNVVLVLAGVGYGATANVLWGGALMLVGVSLMGVLVLALPLALVGLPLLLRRTSSAIS